MPQIGAGSVIDPENRSPGGKYKPEEIVTKLRQAEMLLPQGRSVAKAARSIGVTQFTYYRWRKEFGALTYGIVSPGVFFPGWNADLTKLLVGLLLLLAVLANHRLRQIAMGRA